MSITTDCWTSSIARDVYSTGEFAKMRKRPRFNIGAASRPAPASAPRFSRSRRFKSFLFTCYSVVAGAAWTIDHLTGSRSGVLAAIDDDLTVDKYVIDADRIDEWFFVSGEVLNRVVVENDDVGPASFPDNTARVQSHARGRP